MGSVPQLPTPLCAPPLQTGETEAHRSEAVNLNPTPSSSKALPFLSLVCSWLQMENPLLFPSAPAGEGGPWLTCQLQLGFPRLEEQQQGQQRI